MSRSLNVGLRAKSVVAQRSERAGWRGKYWSRMCQLWALAIGEVVVESREWDMDDGLCTRSGGAQGLGLNTDLINLSSAGETE